MTDDRYKHASARQKSITPRGRAVNFQGESPGERWMGEVEIMCDRDGNMAWHVVRKHIKKYGGKKWTTQSLFFTLSADAWDHLRSAPLVMPPEPES